jgi:hypothetical protein
MSLNIDYLKSILETQLQLIKNISIDVKNKKNLIDEKFIEYKIDNKFYEIFKFILDFYYLIINNKNNLISEYGLNFLYISFQKSNQEIYKFCIDIYLFYKKKILNDYIDIFFETVEVQYYQNLNRNFYINLKNLISLDVDIPKVIIKKEYDNIDFKIFLMNRIKLLKIFSFNIYLINKENIYFDVLLFKKYQNKLDEELINIMNDPKKVNKFFNIEKLSYNVNLKELSKILPFIQISDETNNKKYIYYLDVKILPNISLSLNNLIINLFIIKNKIINEHEVITYFNNECAKELKMLNKPNYRELIHYYYIDPLILINSFSFKIKITIDEIKQQNYKTKEDFFDSIYKKKLIITEIDYIKLKCIHNYIIERIKKFDKNQKFFIDLFKTYIDSDFNCKSCMERIFINIDLFSSNEILNFKVDFNDKKYSFLNKFIDQSHIYIKTIGKIFNISSLIFDDSVSETNRNIVIKFTIDFNTFIKKNEEKIRKNIQIKASEFFIFELENNIFLNYSSNLIKLIDQYLIIKQNNLLIIFCIIIQLLFNNNELNKYLFNPFILIGDQIFKSKFNYLNDNFKQLYNIAFVLILFKQWKFKIEDEKDQLILRIKKYYTKILDLILTYLDIIIYFKNDEFINQLYKLFYRYLKNRGQTNLISKKYILYITSLNIDNLKPIKNLRSFLKYNKKNIFIYFPKKYLIIKYYFKSLLITKIIQPSITRKNISVLDEISKLTEINKLTEIKEIYIKSDIDQYFTQNSYKEMFMKFFKVDISKINLINNIVIFNNRINKIIFNNLSIDLISSFQIINLSYSDDKTFLINNLKQKSDVNITYNFTNLGFLFYNKIFSNCEFFIFIKQLIINALRNSIKPGYREIIRKLLLTINSIKFDNIKNIFKYELNNGIIIENKSDNKYGNKENSTLVLLNDTTSVLLNDSISVLLNDINFFINCLTYFSLFINDKYILNNIFIIFSNIMEYLIKNDTVQKIKLFLFINF